MVLANNLTVNHEISWWFIEFSNDWQYYALFTFFHKYHITIIYQEKEWRYAMQVNFNQLEKGLMPKLYWTLLLPLNKFCEKIREHMLSINSNPFIRWGTIANYIGFWDDKSLELVFLSGIRAFYTLYIKIINLLLQ